MTDKHKYEQTCREIQVIVPGESVTQPRIILSVEAARDIVAALGNQLLAGILLDVLVIAETHKEPLVPL